MRTSSHAGLSELELFDCVMHANRSGDLSHLSSAGKAGHFACQFKKPSPLADEFQNSYYLLQSFRGLFIFLQTYTTTE